DRVKVSVSSKNVCYNWEAHSSSVTWLKFLKFSVLCTSGRNECVSLWDLYDNTARLKTKIPVEDYLGFSRCDITDLGNQQLLCVPGPHQEFVSIWELSSSIKICHLGPENEKGYGSVMQCKWVECGKRLYVLVCYENGSLLLWDWPNCKILSSTECHDNPISLEYDSINKKIICGTASEKVFINSTIVLDKEFNLTNPGVGCVKSRPDGKIYALGGWDYRIRLFSWKKHKPLAVLSYHKKSIECLDFSQYTVETFDPGYLLAAGSSDCTVSLWNLN
ncbi:Guanine nucleotide-binding protein subunit beta-like protein 1, partial [Armadillidium nasatum]